MSETPKPQRIQLSRRKGFRLQEVSMALNGLPAVKCARPSVWGNPFTAGEYGLQLAIKLYRELVCGGWDPGLLSHLSDEQSQVAYKVRNKWIARFVLARYRTPLKEIRHDLRGRNLACFCKLTDPCHCDVLLDLAAR